jgi:hypothetical protein
MKSLFLGVAKSRLPDRCFIVVAEGGIHRATEKDHKIDRHTVLAKKHFIVTQNVV